MTDSNPTRTRFAINKQAFTDVMGDPFTLEPIDGHYNTLRSRSTIQAAKHNFDEGRGTANPARPNAIDFQCDVENAIKDVISDKKLLIKFNETYIHEFITADTELTQSERTDLEQRIGRLFLVRGISPVARYFTTIRR